MMLSNRRGWLVLAITVTQLLGLPLQAAQDPIARLFFKPQERARLDMIRHSGIEVLRPADTSSPDAATTVTLSGIIQQRQGGLRAWVNGMALDSEQFDLPVRAGRELTAQQQLPLLLPGGVTVQPKVGQVVNLSTGELNEGYQHSVEPLVQPTTALDSAAADSEDTPSDPGTN